MVDITEPATSIRLRMSHGCIQSIAAAAGIRILHIKGVSLHPLLAHQRPESTDTDILVDPADINRMCGLLTDSGWQQLTTFAHGSIFRHAAAFHHTTWGTVDVHRSFPGLDRAPQSTFDQLWKSADSVTLGAVRCRTPDLLAQRLLLLTHAARSSSPARNHDIAANWTRLPEEERRRIDQAAAEFGSIVPLALVTGRQELAAGQPDEYLWRAIHAGASPLQIRCAQMRDARTMRDCGRILIDAIRVNHDHLGLRLGHRPSNREVRREWWERLLHRARIGDE